MRSNIKTFTVVIGRDLTHAEALGYPCVYLTYDIGSGRLRQEAVPSGKGGLMGVYSAAEPLGSHDAEAIASDIAGRVKKHSFGGAVLDMPSGEASEAFLARLCPLMARYGIPHYVHAEFARHAPQAKLIVPSAISGGSFREMLAHYASLYGAERLCLELVRTRNDFTIPSPDPSGRLLSHEEFERLFAQSGGGYYSKDLCCRYFTYMGENKTPHFVMFDDAVSAAAKVAIAREAGYYAVFALYGEWGEDIRRIFEYDER